VLSLVSRPEYDKMLYKQRHKIENIFGKIKDWRRIALRYDRCAHTFFSVRCSAAVVIFLSISDVSMATPWIVIKFDVVEDV